MSNLSALLLSGFLITWGCSGEWCSSSLSFSLSVSAPLAGSASLQPVLWVLLPWRTLIQHLSMTRLIIWNCWASGLFWMWLWWPNYCFSRWLQESDVIFHPGSTISNLFPSEKPSPPPAPDHWQFSKHCLPTWALCCFIFLETTERSGFFCSLIESAWERPYFSHLIILFAAKSVDKTSNYPDQKAVLRCLRWERLVQGCHFA